MAVPASDVSASLPADWCERLRRSLLALPDHRPEHSRLGGLATSSQQLREQLLENQPAMLAAAVLVPIITAPGAPALLLTVRASHLRRHAGQISFPGGRLEATDLDIAAAAIRETGEEIGIGAQFIEPIGFLSDLLVQTGYRITPVVALLRPGFTLSADSTEVAEVFELPLAAAVAPQSYRLRRRVLRGLEVEGWELPFGGYEIWGATAGILANLREVFGAFGP
jgi:8-oxo-dGTP pyrophosphatase MutT (NUDIX family)